MTDECIQSVQEAMIKAETPKKKKRFQVFFSKTEDFHRLMNVLEVGFTIIFFFFMFHYRYSYNYVFYYDKFFK